MPPKSLSPVAASTLPDDAVVRDHDVESAELREPAGYHLGIPVVYTSDYLVPDEPDWRQLEQDIGRLIRGLAEAT